MIKDTEPPEPSEEANNLISEYDRFLDEVAKCQALINADIAEQYKAEKEISKLDAAIAKITSQMTAVCIKARSDDLTQALRNDYKEASKAMGMKKGNEGPLQVFHVSSWAFEHLTNGQQPPDGFFTKSDTGIPSLQDWIVEATLNTRRANAESFLENLVHLQVSFEPWLASNLVEFKMTNSERKVIKSIFKEGIAELEKVSHSAPSFTS